MNLKKKPNYTDVETDLRERKINDFQQPRKLSPLDFFKELNH